MSRLFVDSFYYIALLNPRDTFHRIARSTASTVVDDQFFTTDLVLVEIANALSAPRLRDFAAAFLRTIEQSSDTTIVRLNVDFFERSLALYEQRPDKEWSLTDCLSFVAMTENGITEALTGDHHFVQAGFRALLRETAEE